MAKKKEIEKLLVSKFCEFVRSYGNDEFSVTTIHNASGDTNEYADIELTTATGVLVAIEAKTHETRDAPNTVHKVFGQLLAEHGKTNPQRRKASACFGILIPAEKPMNPDAPKSCGTSYYQRRFRNIPENKFEEFGVLVDAKYVFVFRRTRPQQLDVYGWMDFYRNKKPITTITTNDEIHSKQPVA